MMEVGDLVTRNFEPSVPYGAVGVIVKAEEEDEIVVVWSDGYRNTYSIYDLEEVCKSET